MRLLAFSDLHRDVVAAHSLVRRSTDVDVVVGAGDFAVQRQGLLEVIDVLRAIEKPCVLVAGNGSAGRIRISRPVAPGITAQP